MEKSTRVGRPTIENSKKEQIHIRVTKSQKEAIMNLAQKKGVGISGLILVSLKID